MWEEASHVYLHLRLDQKFYMDTFHILFSWCCMDIFYVPKYVQHHFSYQIILYWLLNHYSNLGYYQLSPIINYSVIKTYSYYFESKSFHSFISFMLILRCENSGSSTIHILPMSSVNDWSSYRCTSSMTQFWKVIIV